MYVSSWIKLSTIVAIWALTASTWASIAHHLLGAPDFGLPAVIAAIVLGLAWPVRAQLSRRA